MQPKVRQDHKTQMQQVQVPKSLAVTPVGGVQHNKDQIRTSLQVKEQVQLQEKSPETKRQCEKVPEKGQEKEKVQGKDIVQEKVREKEKVLEKGQNEAEGDGSLVREIARLRASVVTEQRKSIEMCKVVDYLEKAKEELEKDKRILKKEALERELKLPNGVESKGISEKLEASQNQITSLLNTIKTTEASWKCQEANLTKAYTAKVKSEQEKTKLLEESTKAVTKVDATALKNETKIIEEKNIKPSRDLMESMASLAKMVENVKHLNETKIKAEEKLANVESENLKLKESNVIKARLTRDTIEKLEANMKTLEDEKEISETRSIELESHFSDMSEDVEDAKKKLTEMEEDCAEAMSKYKELQEQKLDAVKKFQVVEKEKEGAEKARKEAEIKVQEAGKKMEELKKTHKEEIER